MFDFIGDIIGSINAGISSAIVFLEILRIAIRLR